MFSLETKKEKFMDMIAIKMNQHDEAIKRLEGRIEETHQDNQLMFKTHSSQSFLIEISFFSLRGWIRYFKNSIMQA